MCRFTSAVTIWLLLTVTAAAQSTISTADKLRPANTLTVSPVGDVIFAPGGKDVYPAVGYDVNLGLIGKKYLTLHVAELWAETLVAQNTLATIGGRVLVGSTTTLTADLTAAATSITVKHNSLASGDRVYLEAAGQVEFLAITSAASGSGPYTYTVTRNLDGTGANAWYAGDAVFNTGQTGSGFIDLYSVRGMKAASEAGPTIVGNVRQSATYNDWAPRWAIGNLNGLYGKSSNVWGFAAGDYTKSWLTLNDTDGLWMGYGSTPYLTIDPTGSATFAGRVTVGGSSNQLSNAEFRRGLTEGAGPRFPAASGSATWFVGAAGTHAGNWEIAYNATGWTLAGAGTAYARNLVTADATDQAYLEGPTLPVMPGARYEWSAYVISLRGQAVMELVWWTADNALVSTVAGSEGTYSAPTHGNTLDQYRRLTLIATAPATAAKASLRIRWRYDYGGTDHQNPHLFFTRLFFAEARAGQTEVSPWAPGGVTQITGDSLATDLVVANKIRSAGATALETGSGLWIDTTGPAPTFRIGNPNGNRLIYDGSSLVMHGNIYGPEWQLTESGGLYFSGDTGGDNERPEQLIRWGNYGSVGGNPYRTWMRGPNGALTFKLYGNSWAWQVNGDTKAELTDGGWLHLVGGLVLPSAPTMTGNAWPMVLGPSNTLYAKTNGLNGWHCSGGVSTIYFDSGIATDIRCTDPAPSGSPDAASTSAEVASLHTEVAQLRAVVQQLLAAGVGTKQ